MGEGDGEIDWEKLNDKLPYERTDAAQDKRKRMFKDFDPNRNGYLSLAEVKYLKKKLKILKHFR